MNADQICPAIAIALLILGASIYVYRWLSAPSRQLARLDRIAVLFLRRQALISEIERSSRAVDGLGADLFLRADLSSIDDELMRLGVDPKVLI
jgi:hypothetical protein